VVVDKIRTMWLTEPNFTAEELASIQSPTLVIHGQKDELVRADHAASIAKAIPGAKFLLLPDAEHHAMTRRPKEWNKAVMAFLIDNGVPH
jgi:pimeloyl-ACP methyl ester carboxylesterase